MVKQKETLKGLEKILSKIEADISRARAIISQMSLTDEEIQQWEWINYEELASKMLNYNENDDVKVIEWVFDWYFMIWSDWKKYPVPLNYASKTKLISWDILKLRILQDWKLMYKLIWEAPRKFIKATLSKSDDNKFIGITEEWKAYSLNQAAVTFFKWKPWDELSIVINSDWNWDYAAIEALIPSN